MAGVGPVRLHRDRARGGRVLPSHQAGDLPRADDRGDLPDQRRAAVRGDRQQHHQRQRRRSPAAAQPRQPGAVAARGPALPAGDAALPRAAARRGRRRRALRVHRGVRQALPVARDRRGDGRAAERRPAAAPLVEHDPASVRRRQPDLRPRADRAGRGRVLRLRGRADPQPPRGPRRRSDLGADRGRGGRRQALGQRAAQPDPEHPGRRRRHQPEPARARGQAAGRSTPISGRRCAPTRKGWRWRRSTRPSATSRSRRSPRGS